MYEMKLRSTGNPDFGQYTPISNPETVRAESLFEMRAHCERYIEDWDMGGGNWMNPPVYEIVPGRKSKKIVGYFSYNGRLWKTAPHKWVGEDRDSDEIEIARPENLTWKIETRDLDLDDPVWESAGIRFQTEEAAKAHATEMKARSTGTFQWRIFPTTEPVTEKIEVPVVKAKFVVIETMYGCVDAEMDDDQYVFSNVYADHFTSMKEAEEYASERNVTHGQGGRYSYHAAIR